MVPRRRETSIGGAVCPLNNFCKLVPYVYKRATLPNSQLRGGPTFIRFPFFLPRSRVRPPRTLNSHSVVSFRSLFDPARFSLQLAPALHASFQKWNFKTAPAGIKQLYGHRKLCRVWCLSENIMFPVARPILRALRSLIMFVL